MGDELFLFYSERKAVATLAWRESAVQMCFFATDKESREVLAQAKLDDRREKVRRQLEKSGGVLVSAVQSGDDTCRLTVETGSGGTYQPPSRILLFGMGEGSRWRELNGQPVSLKKYQLALVPVDNAAERKLAALEEGLSDLPADVRGAVLRALVRSEGVARTAATDTPRRGWIAVLLGVLLGLAGGGGGYFAYAKYYSPEARVWRARNSHQKQMGPALTRLEEAVRTSPNPEIKAMYFSHLAPLTPGSKHDSTMLRVEALLVTKLALYNKTGSMTDSTWSESANANALKQLVSSNTDFNTIQAVSCLGDPPALSEANACDKVDWQAATERLNALTSVANPALKTAPVASAIPVVPPAQTGGGPPLPVAAPAVIGSPTTTTIGTVQSLPATAFTITDKANKTYAVTINPNTVVIRDTVAGAAGQLRKGDAVSVEGPISAKTIQAKKITVVPTVLTGKVQTLGNDTITIIVESDPQKKPITLFVGSQTTYTEGRLDNKKIAQGKIISWSDIKPDNIVEAQAIQTEGGYQAVHLTAVPTDPH
jgi:Domain of unknown function (DUF5666)